MIDVFFHSIPNPVSQSLYCSARHRTHAHSKAKFLRSFARRSCPDSRVSTYGMVSSSPFFTRRTVSTVTHPCASKD